MTTQRFKIKVDNAYDIANFKCFVENAYDNGEFTITVEVYDECERFIGERHINRCNIMRKNLSELIDKMFFVDPTDKKYDVYIDYRLK